MGAVIRIKPVDEEWTTLGAEAYRGVVPEGIEATANPWGPDRLSFGIKTVQENALRPELLPYTPVELEVDGMLVWAGRIRERPSERTSHQVNCEGWQYHLDDDDLERVYVHAKLSEWQDGRSFLDTDLSARTAAWQVTNGEGRILLALPAAATAATTKSCSVVLDLGPDSTCKRIVVVANSGHPAAGWKFHIRGASSSPTGNDEDQTNDNPAAADTTYALTFSTPRRYVELLWANETGAGGTGTETTWVSIKSAMIFRDTAYESGNASILKADTVVLDSLATAPLITSKSDYITAGTFSIPAYQTNDYQTPREIIESVNAYENYRTKIGGPDLRSLIYGPKPTVPLYEVGAWTGSEFADASMSGVDIYNRVIVSGTAADGSKLVSKRTQTGTLFDRLAGLLIDGGPAAYRSRVLPIRNPMTQAVGDRFGDLWLTEHKTSPFSGKLSASYGIRRHIGGQKVSPHELLLAAGEKINLSHRIDPDTGAWGRVGEIAAITYNHDQRSVAIDIDDRRDHFETILSRYGILVDQLS